MSLHHDALLTTYTHPAYAYARRGDGAPQWRPVYVKSVRLVHFAPHSLFGVQGHAQDDVSASSPLDALSRASNDERLRQWREASTGAQGQAYVRGMTMDDVVTRILMRGGHDDLAPEHRLAFLFDGQPMERVGRGAEVAPFEGLAGAETDEEGWEEEEESEAEELDVDEAEMDVEAWEEEEEEAE